MTNKTKCPRCNKKHLSEDRFCSCCLADFTSEISIHIDEGGY
jgi:predicted amidophosphoribosyltransferase